MEQTKYNRLKADCKAEIAKGNLEKCLELLGESLENPSATYNEFIAYSSRYNRNERENSNSLILRADYTLEYNQLVKGLLKLIDNLPEEDVSLLNRIHDLILVVACKNSPTNWESIFNEAYFSHKCIIRYKDEVPEEFKSPDVIVFDDLECNVKNTTAMGGYISDMPLAHYLYVGPENPLKEENPAAFKRSANANSIITVYARLRELLEYRKICSDAQK